LKAVSIPARSVGWLGEKKLSRIMLIVGAILLAALVVGLLGFLFVQDVLSFGKFPNGVRIVGVSVSGLNQQEALTSVKTELAGVVNKPLTLKVEDEKYQIPPRELGLMLDYGKMVEEGYTKAWSVNIFERMARRFTNRPKEFDISIVANSDVERVQNYLNTVINSINRYPRDAYVDVTSGKPVIVKAQEGRNCIMSQLQKDVDSALVTPNRTVNVPSTSCQCSTGSRSSPSSRWRAARRVTRRP
jgi:hypothetical protein